MARPAKAPARRSFFGLLFRQHERNLRTEPTLGRSYLMAQPSRFASSWATSGGDPNRMLSGSLSALRARSRDLVRNVDYARGFMSKVRVNVVGSTGVRLRIDARRPDGSRDREDSERVEAAFGDWSKRGACTVDGEMSFRDVQALAMRGLIRDGEVILRKRYGRAMGPSGFRLQFIDPDQLDELHNERLAGGRRVVMGVEIDADGRRLAYHLKSDHPDALVSLDRQRRVRVPADEIIHAFLVEEVGQVRGAPWLNPSGRQLYQLDRYAEAEVVAARVAASKMGFYEMEDGAGYGPSDDDNAETGRGAFVEHAEPGEFPVLPVGVKFKSYDPQHPTTAFEGFIKQALRGAAAGVGLSYVAFSGDLEGVNYSSIRQGVLEDRGLWQDLQAWLAEHVLTPVFEAWLDAALVSGVLAPIPASRFDKLNRPVWHARGWAWVDPLKEITAREKEVALGVTSRRRTATETGRDFDQVAEELAQEEGGPRVYRSPEGASSGAETETEGLEDD